MVLHADPAQRCYVPLVVDKNANMKLLHLGALLSGVVWRIGLVAALPACETDQASAPVACNVRLVSCPLADSMDGVEAVPPFGIREPSQTYADGQLREDGALLAVPVISSICKFSCMALLQSDLLSFTGRHCERNDRIINQSVMPGARQTMFTR